MGLPGLPGVDGMKVGAVNRFKEKNCRKQNKQDHLTCNLLWDVNDCLICLDISR